MRRHACMDFDVCGGSTRVCAQQVTGNASAENLGWHLDDDEIVGAANAAARRRRASRATRHARNRRLKWIESGATARSVLESDEAPPRTNTNGAVGIYFGVVGNCKYGFGGTWSGGGILGAGTAADPRLGT